MALPRASARAVRKLKLRRRGDRVPAGRLLATSSTASPTTPRSLGTSSRIVSEVTWSSSTSEGRERLLGGARDRKQRIELGQLEQRLQIRVEAGQPQFSPL